jgi:hypothetical protein
MLNTNFEMDCYTYCRPLLAKPASPASGLTHTAARGRESHPDIGFTRAEARMQSVQTFDISHTVVNSNTCT